MVVLVPVPENTAKATLLVTVGKAKYDATKKALVREGLPVGICEEDLDPFLSSGVEDLQVHGGGGPLAAGRSDPGFDDQGEEAVGAAAHLDAVSGG